MKSSDYGGWLYNGNSPRQPGEPADLGYYEGYKICLAFLQFSTDKPKALAQIIAIDNEEHILMESHYQERFRK